MSRRAITSGVTAEIVETVSGQHLRITGRTWGRGGWSGFECDIKNEDGIQALIEAANAALEFDPLADLKRLIAAHTETIDTLRRDRAELREQLADIKSKWNVALEAQAAADRAKWERAPDVEGNGGRTWKELACAQSDRLRDFRDVALELTHEFWQPFTTKMPTLVRRLRELCD